ncbi:cobyrinic acid a,c-diamide synthase [Scytonema hofmannii PCC 7110]|uniref:Cobyrinate a,c-diamide synthase n=1 Tax=Scytonema hofmannii PCC 7110 TaxID=128403 RepID=A0A139X4R0_9CYAN|nr:cobyrinate a,c-diamide synthase [Scytonema hofmannii]KYC39701.1 cobyrinic acid a,c-diamide synthase [Scytonema hofmannii PCC 7110]
MSLIIAGERSGVGKTTVVLTFLASLCRHGFQVQSFKVGPDYIDPMFHQYVTGRACRNLDPVLTSETYVQECFTYHSQLCEYAIVEGVMGLFDGISSLVIGHSSSANDKGQMTNYASTAHIAKLLDLPVVLVIDSSRLSGSVAAIAHGYRSYNPTIKIVGVVLNRVGSDRHLDLLKNALEPLQLPILGVLRREDNITIPDRHLGLVPTAELPQMDALINRLADLGDSCFDWERLLPLLKVEIQNCHRRCTQTNADKGENDPRSSATGCVSKDKIPVAIARDRAFNFYYQDNLDLLQELGAELVFWSPLEDAELPKGVKGMYFGGGFPEVFARQLAENANVLTAINSAIVSGMPTIAECGGLMYLCKEIVDFEGKSWSMVGVLPTTAVMGKHLTLGYRRAIAQQDSLLIRAGTTVCGHEFHRSRLTLTSHQPLFQTYRYDSQESTGYEGWSLPSSLHASYIHLHWGEHLEIPQRFLKSCQEFFHQQMSSEQYKQL